MKMIDRIRKFQERAGEQAAGRVYRDDENIFFNLTEGAHRIRLVGDFICVCSHWIAPSGYSRISLYQAEAFQGSDRIRKIVNCPDFDIDTETFVPEKNCTLCKLRAVANALLNECFDLEPRQREFLENISYACRTVERTFFLCLDRDNPEIAPGRRGFKIIEFPRPLMEQWIRLVQSCGEPECTSVEEGLEWIVTRKKEGTKSRYSIRYAMRGAAVCRSTLSEEERAYEYHDIRKIMGKMPDQQQLFDRLRPEFRELIREGWRMEEETENAVMPEAEDEQIPF